MGGHLLGDWHVFSLYTVPLMRFLAIEASIFLCATVLRLLVLYTQPKLTCFKSKNLRDSILIFSRYSYVVLRGAPRSLLHASATS